MKNQHDFEKKFKNCIATKINNEGNPTKSEPNWIDFFISKSLSSNFFEDKFIIVVTGIDEVNGFIAKIKNNLLIILVKLAKNIITLR